MGGKAPTPAEPEPIKPPDPKPDPNASPDRTSAPGNVYAAAVAEEEDRKQAGATLGDTQQGKAQTRKRDPSSMVASGPTGGMASSAVLTG